jgi:[ribosomal protein S5]-alanine N-acetyltransferase
MNLLNVEIVSERLRLVPTADKYAQDIYKEFTSEITTFMTPTPPKKIEDTLKYIKYSRINMKKGSDLLMVILNKKNGEFIGHCGIHKLNTSMPALGVWIKKSAHGNKYGREAVKTLKKWCDENKKYEYITYSPDKANIASRKIAESLDGEVVKEYKRTNESGEVVDALEYWIYPN